MPSTLDRLEAFTDQIEEIAVRFNEGVVDAVEGLAWWTDRSGGRSLNAVSRGLSLVAHVLAAVARIAVFYVPAVVLGVGGAAAENGWLVTAAAGYAVAVTAAGVTYLRRERGPEV